ncbi:hypothetical protein [Cellulosilyticum ruminicola]|uniref:hypothetical protein n=1 Tax=Cellulosilyticum ruminicola TaxID=425254 RepID=UPI0006D29AA8|nr:hypothetical protein [Cellulosilyticum ruminicola]
MKTIIVPKVASIIRDNVTTQEIEEYFKAGGKAPSIKEQLILKAFEITQDTKMFFETEDVILLYSSDKTGTYLSCFNKKAEETSVEIPLSAMKLEGKYIAYCVLTSEEISVDDVLSLQIPDGGVLLVKLLKED